MEVLAKIQRDGSLDLGISEYFSFVTKGNISIILKWIEILKIHTALGRTYSVYVNYLVTILKVGLSFYTYDIAQVSTLAPFCTLQRIYIQLCLLT